MTPKKAYERAIANWPEEDRPREKLLKFGAHALSNAELLAILIRIGVKGSAQVIAAWIKSTDQGFYPIEYAWRKGEHTKRGFFNPDFFIKRQSRFGHRDQRG